MEAYELKAITVYFFLSLIFALAALAASANTVCHFTHTVTSINTSPEQILLILFSLFNLTVVLIKLFKNLPLINRDFQQGNILVDNQQFVLDAGIN
ncbi:hypothetical protein [Thalassomonas actiniarum]|uniref:Uncharacterized protein n=1 Tax=Thalassomonas actiniarum TaxID=485447 RepID=A0AAE9YN40_9GAMM|nr:hypothetical protein [Thalassomonas actiniarum]WDD97438.1 hypothetical protein SG35_019230 [Thalassomonas actiniarum]